MTARSHTKNRRKEVRRRRLAFRLARERQERQIARARGTKEVTQ